MMLYLPPHQVIKLIAERINSLLSVLTYMSYSDLMGLTLPMIEALVKAKVDSMAANPAAAGMGQIANLFGGGKR